MTVSFHKYGEYFPGTGDLKVSWVAPGEGQGQVYWLLGSQEDLAIWWEREE